MLPTCDRCEQHESVSWYDANHTNTLLPHSPDVVNLCEPCEESVPYALQSAIHVHVRPCAQCGRTGAWSRTRDDSYLCVSCNPYARIPS